jgi:hypothetical protein
MGTCDNKRKQGFAIGSAWLTTQTVLCGFTCTRRGGIRRRGADETPGVRSKREAQNVINQTDLHRGVTFSSLVVLVRLYGVDNYWSKTVIRQTWGVFPSSSVVFPRRVQIGSGFVLITGRGRMAEIR